MLDVHVLLEGVRPPRDDDPAPERDLLTRIRDVCAIVLMDPTLVRQAGLHAARHGVPVFWQNELVRELEDLGKLRRPGRSGLVGLSSSEARVFRRRGHDDAHLYALARTYDREVITRDPNLLRRRGEIQKMTGVRTSEVEELLEE